MPRSFVEVFRKYRRYNEIRGDVQVGLQTSDNYRFLRLAWEVPSVSIGQTRAETITRSARWVFYAKGGDYAPYYADIHLLVDWQNDGRQVKSFSDSKGNIISYPRNERYYFSSGLTYTERTTSNFSARILPEGCCFDTKGPRISSENKQLDLVDMIVLMTRPIAYMLEFVVGSADAAARDYTPRAIAELPYRRLSHEQETYLEKCALRIWELHYKNEKLSETDRFFFLPQIWFWGMDEHLATRFGLLIRKETRVFWRFLNFLSLPRNVQEAPTV
jgi:hypothetical protein